MLVIKLNSGQAVFINGANNFFQIQIRNLGREKGQQKIGFEAEMSVRILRSKLFTEEAPPLSHLAETFKAPLDSTFQISAARGDAPGFAIKLMGTNIDDQTATIGVYAEQRAAVTVCPIEELIAH